MFSSIIWKHLRIGLVCSKMRQQLLDCLLSCTIDFLHFSSFTKEKKVKKNLFWQLLRSNSKYRVSGMTFRNFSRRAEMKTLPTQHFCQKCRCLPTLHQQQLYVDMKITRWRIGWFPRNKTSIVGTKLVILMFFVIHFPVCALNCISNAEDVKKQCFSIILESNYAKTMTIIAGLLLLSFRSGRKL